jgi:hypothetical protein
MDDATLIDRLGALQPPAIDSSRERAVAGVPARVRAAGAGNGRGCAAHLAGIGSASKGPTPIGIRSRRRRQLPLIALGIACLAAAIVALVSLGGSGPEQPSRAYGADLIRFADSSPLLLLEGPGWRVQNVDEERSREGIEGSMEFVTGQPLPYETLRITGNDETGQHESGMRPAAVRQRKVELAWSHRDLAETVAFAHQRLHSHGQHWVKAPVLGTTAYVDTRDEVFVNQGGPGDHQMTAYWSEDGYLLEMRAAVPDLAGFEERLGWLTEVDRQAWLEAMPAKVVKAGDHDAAVREMLRGIPVPSTFEPSRVPDEGLTTNRYQVGAKVTGTVSCLWLRQWGEARRTGDREAELEADRAMATARHWPILREMVKDGDYPEVLWETAAAMPSGYWEYAGHQRRLLPHAEGLGCARLGLPLLSSKQKLQRERGLPLPRG